MNTPENVVLDPGIGAGKALEKSTDEGTFAGGLVRAGVKHRPDPGCLEPVTNYFFSEVIKRSDDDDGVFEERLPGKNGAGRRGKKKV